MLVLEFPGMHPLTLFLRRLLAEQKDMDERRRQVIFELLAEEEAKQQAATSGAKRCPAIDFTHPHRYLRWKQIPYW
ncbi:MAG TPA: hypothetical protein VLQ90_04770 [Pyrinomonadaceae bacterium]|nr:hypothetical protein [Pyrinomonadaceae bacterium]